MTSLVGFIFGGAYFRNFTVPYYRELKLHTPYSQMADSRKKTGA